MTWSDTGELIKASAAVATALAAWFAASVAYRGLEKWRTETLGKRKAELAASVLAAVYEFEEVIRSGREPWVLPHEMAKREGIPDEIAQNANYAPEARLLAQQAFFARFRSMKHEFAAVFGRESAKIFDGLWRVRLDINHAVFASKEVRGLSCLISCFGKKRCNVPNIQRIKKFGMNGIGRRSGIQTRSKMAWHSELQS